MFKLYAQQKGGESQFMGITTSWAGMYFSVPTDLQGEQEIRFGVAAVSVDMKSDSEIAWSDYMSMGEYTVTDDIQINKLPSSRARALNSYRRSPSRRRRLEIAQQHRCGRKRRKQYDCIYRIGRY